MDWFRSYHGAPSDTKLALIAIKSGQPRALVTAVWWEVLDHASRNVTHGHARGDVSQIDPEIVAHQQGMTPDQVQSILSAMADKGMIADGRVVNWDKHQVKREDTQAAERKREQRERDRAAAASAEAASRDVTQCRAMSPQRREEEKRGEKKQKDKPSAAGKRMPFVELPPDWLAWAVDDRGWDAAVVADVWSHFREYWKTGKGRSTKREDWEPTWRNWCRKENIKPKENHHAAHRPNSYQPAKSKFELAVEATERARALRESRGPGPA